MRVRSRTLLSSVGAAALTLASLPWAGPAHAATFTVTKTADTNDGACTPSDCSLREAITAANASPGPDTINLPGGDFPLTIPGANDDTNATGDLDVTGDLTLNGNGSTVDGNDLDRVFHILNGNVKLLNLTIRNGDTSGSGGGIFSEGGTTLELRNATVTDNVAGSSGGGVSSLGTLRVVNSLISNNAGGGGGSGSGGGIFSSGGPVTIVGTTISGNRAAFEGGGMDANSPTTITNSRFVGNAADPDDHGGGDGGGLVVDSNTTTLNNVQFSDNVTGDDGGAIEVEGAGTLNYNGGQVSGNKAGGDGGGIDNQGTTRLNRVSIGNNVADANADGSGDAGGFDNDGGSATSTQSQISGNDDRSGDQFDNCRPTNAVPGCAP